MRSKRLLLLCHALRCAPSGLLHQNRRARTFPVGEVRSWTKASPAEVRWTEVNSVAFRFFFWAQAMFVLVRFVSEIKLRLCPVEPGWLGLAWRRRRRVRFRFSNLPLHVGSDWLSETGRHLLWRTRRNSGLWLSLSCAAPGGRGLGPSPDSRLP